MSVRILVAEDETKIADVLCDYIKASGFEPHHVADGARVLPTIKEIQPDLVLLDVMLPNLDGMEILKRIRANSNLPVIMVTARVEEIDRLLGLEFGADDYICKPFSPREVIARVKSVLRRMGPAEMRKPDEAVFHLDSESFEARAAGQALNLTPNEFRLLQIFVAHPGRVYSRAQLIDQINDDFHAVSDRSIDSHVKNLRKKIAAVIPDKEFIASVYGVGYKYAPVA